jgi:hypothetical protein
LLDGSSYSMLDRMMHRVAFGHRSVQKVLSEIEASAFSQEWRDTQIDRPIFITSLPRAGTTLLLQLLARLPSVATHTYRDMPFVMAPVLWNRISKSFHSRDNAVERAHGDGMMVSVDSPEAFEEVLWLSHFQENYRDDGILPWQDIPDSFVHEFTDHMRRIVHLRGQNGRSGIHYLSKNNANIARVGALGSAFPDSTILVPLRHPLAQAQSMLRQHKRFGELHAGDKFSMRYMADIGHFEFGLPHRPILFSGFENVRNRYGPDEIEYWIGYWIVAYRQVESCANATFIDYEGFCRDGDNFKMLCHMIGLDAEQKSVETASREIRPQEEIKYPKERPENLAEAEALFNALRVRSPFHFSSARILPVRK